MADYDVFNGDADGICSLIQLRLNEPKESTLITGVKRDIKLLQQVKAERGDSVTVLDISMEKNMDALQSLLSEGIAIFYADHHRSGEIPKSENLEPYIDLASDTCTALIVDKYLEGKYRAWALTAAFGDNLKKEASSIAKSSGFNGEQISLMDELGTYINYNGYGSSLDDLFYQPAELYKILKNYETPFEFIDNDSGVFDILKNGYSEDMDKAASLKAEYISEKTALFILPNEKWARRVSGVYSNQLALDNPSRAHAVLTEKPNGNFLVSIRAPKDNPQGASDIASQFPTGGGRAAAAGINDLPTSELKNFYETLNNYYS
ncbi:MAG: hypothetical protein MK132_04735 [Lentisphaerales bacterium]|nr:hypothetical protein [Lentisphaerales bacterium]